MNGSSTQEFLTTAQASVARRWLGVGMTAVLGALLVYVGFLKPPASLGWQVFLVVLGGVAIALSVKMHAATRLQLRLTADALIDSEDQVIARIEDIVAVERGTFAFKPSNGFMIRLSQRQPGSWHPGIWWRLGRRVGIGGVIPGAQTKLMAEMIQALIADHTA